MKQCLYKKRTSKPFMLFIKVKKNLLIQVIFIFLGKCKQNILLVHNMDNKVKEIVKKKMMLMNMLAFLTLLNCRHQQLIYSNRVQLEALSAKKLNL